MDYLITDFGAVSDGQTVNTKAIQAALDKAGELGGRVIVPPGEWLCGTIYLRSHTELHLQRGAQLLGTNNPEDYPKDCPVEAGLVVSRRAFDRRMVYGCNVEDVAITGPGTIDGRGGCAHHKFPDKGHEGRPNNIQFVKCKGVTVRDVRLRHAGSWMQQYLCCEDVHLHGLRVWNHGNHTNDGLDVDGSKDVRISDCDIDSHDDALVFKSTGPSPCENIMVTNCRLRSNCHGIKFGTESVGGFINIQISNCVISPSRVPAPLVSHPEGRPVITGCALECTDGGVMRNINISNIIVEKVFTPIFVKLGNRHDRRVPDENFLGAGEIENIQISKIIAREAGPIPCSISGYPGNPVRNVFLSDITIESVGRITTEEILPEVPENSDSYPEVNMFQKVDGKKTDQHLPAWGFFLRHVDGLSMKAINLTLSNSDAREKIVEEDVRWFD